MTDKAIGSVHYIAPEQARGDLTDDKADIYSVGVMLYEMITGQLPFEADNAVSVAIMQLQADPKPPRDINPTIPIGLEEITLKAMQKTPAQRYQSAAEMMQDIEAFRQKLLQNMWMPLLQIPLQVQFNMMTILNILTMTSAVIQKAANQKAEIKIKFRLLW